MKKHGLAALALLLAMGGALGQEARPKTPGQTLYLPVYSHLLYGNVDTDAAADFVLLLAAVTDDPGSALIL